MLIFLLINEPLVKETGLIINSIYGPYNNENLDVYLMRCGDDRYPLQSGTNSVNNRKLDRILKSRDKKDIIEFNLKMVIEDDDYPRDDIRAYYGYYLIGDFKFNE